MDDQLLLNIEQTAHRLGFGRSFTYRLIQTGELPSLKIGGARRILASDIEAYIQRVKAEQHDAA